MVAVPAPTPVASPRPPPPKGPPPPFETEAMLASDVVQLALPVTTVVVPLLYTALAWNGWVLPTRMPAGLAGVTVSPTSVGTAVTVRMAVSERPW